MRDYFVHEQGICESNQVGKDTRVWAFAHVLPGARIGSECNVCDHVFIENDVILGNRVTLKCGVQLWDGIRIEDDVFIGPNVTFTNDRFPRSKQYPDEFLKTTVHKGASIGANATLLPGISVGQHAMVGAGSVVTQSVPPYAIVVGKPATIVGYVNSIKEDEGTVAPVRRETANTSVPGVTLHHFPHIHDLRGDLSVGEFERDIPFYPKRYFLVFDVPSRKVRGEHAHRQCHQFLICVKGSISVVADDGQAREEFALDSPAKGLYLPPMVWGIQYKASADAVLLVFASDFYDPADYIRNYDDFLREVSQR